LNSRLFVLVEGSMAIKQVIVWRHDLQCRLGKKMAQAGHAVLADFSKTMFQNIDDEGNVSFKLTPAQLAWHKGNFRKIVLRVDSEDQLMVIYNRAEELGLPVELIIDSGLTEWDIPTKTCLAIGPEEDSKIDEVTGKDGPLGRLRLM